MTTGIYKITNPKGKVYIGKSVWIERRWKEHLCDGSHSSGPKLTNSFKKYGKDSHTFEIIEECTNLLERERYYQEVYNSVEDGLNHVLTTTEEHPGGEEVICTGCKKHFRKSKSHLRKTNYCSFKCFNESRNITSKCKNCGSKFEHHKNTKRSHCSRMCYNNYQRGRKLVER